MKKYAAEFVKRGLMAAGGGPVVLVIVYAILGATGAVVSFTPGEVCLGVLSVTLMAFISAGITMIYTVESLPLPMAILIHGGVLYLDYLLVYLLNSWIPRNFQAIGIFSMIFLLGFALIWLTVYLCNRRDIRKLNEKLRAEKE